MITEVGTLLALLVVAVVGGAVLYQRLSDEEETDSGTGISGSSQPSQTISPGDTTTGTERDPEHEPVNSEEFTFHYDSGGIAKVDELKLDQDLEDLPCSGTLREDDRVEEAVDVLNLVLNEELESVEGIGPNYAERIKEGFNVDFR